MLFVISQIKCEIQLKFYALIHPNYEFCMQLSHYKSTMLWFCCRESFDRRAPKRKQVVKVKKSFPTFSRNSISNRPPAALPEDEEISFENHPQYVPIGTHMYTHTLPALGSRQNSVEYESVKPRSNTIPKLKDANTVLTQGKNVTCSYVQ